MTQLLIFLAVLAILVIVLKCVISKSENFTGMPIIWTAHPTGRRVTGVY